MAPVYLHKPAGRILVEMFIMGVRTPSVIHVVDASSMSRVLGYKFRFRLFYAADQIAFLIIRCQMQ